MNTLTKIAENIATKKEIKSYLKKLSNEELEKHKDWIGNDLMKNEVDKEIRLRKIKLLK